MKGYMSPDIEGGDIFLLRRIKELDFFDSRHVGFFFTVKVDCLQGCLAKAAISSCLILNRVVKLFWAVQTAPVKTYQQSSDWFIICMKSKMVVPTQPVVEVVARVCRESPEKESLAGGEHKQDGKMVDYVLSGRGIMLMLFDCKKYVLFGTLASVIS